MAAGVEGTVKEIGLFATTIIKSDNASAFVGNSKTFSYTVQNSSTSPYRRVERLAQLAHGVDPHDAMSRLKTTLAKIPNITKDPAPDVEIIDFNDRGPVLPERPYTPGTLLAGVPRHQQGDQADLRRGMLSGARGALPGNAESSRLNSR
jgi:small conductance mechanosensitive channel